MDYNRIVAVTGLPGLFEVVSSKTDGAIVRSLDDKSTRFVSSRIHNLSHLESIEVYTVRDNVGLTEIFVAMKNGNGALPDVKDNKALKSYFEKVFPDLDFERVYSSDMKKMVKWYETLRDNDVDFTVKPQQEEEAEEEVAVVATEEEAPKKAAKPKAKAKAKATPAAEAETPAAEEEKPKRTRKKKEDPEA
jgi:hypothetical protein